MGSPSAYSLIFVGESGEDLMSAGGSYHLASACRYPLAGVNWVLRFPLFFGYVVRRTLILGTKNLSLGRKTLKGFPLGEHHSSYFPARQVGATCNGHWGYLVRWRTFNG